MGNIHDLVEHFFKSAQDSTHWSQRLPAGLPKEYEPGDFAKLKELYWQSKELVRQEQEFKQQIHEKKNIVATQWQEVLKRNSPLTQAQLEMIIGKRGQ